MKKMFLCLVAFISIYSFVNAQDVAVKAEAPKLTKEQKAEMAAKKEADLVELFKRADLTADQEKQVRAAMDEASAKNKVIKSDAALSEDDKKAKMKEVSDAKNAKLKEIMGADKYKAYNTAKKAQKEANDAAEAAKKN